MKKTEPKRKLCRKMGQIIEISPIDGFRIGQVIHNVYVLDGSKAALEEMVEIVARLLNERDYDGKPPIVEYQREYSRTILTAILGHKFRRAKE